MVFKFSEQIKLLYVLRHIKSIESMIKSSISNYLIASYNFLSYPSVMGVFIYS